MSIIRDNQAAGDGSYRKTVLRPPLPWLGKRSDKVELCLALAVSAVICVLYVIVARIVFDAPTTGLEIVSLIASIACVWLARTENVWTMGTGIIACVTMGVFFLRIDLVGQGWLQLAFYVPAQLLGWVVWCRGGSRRTELPPSRLTAASAAATVVALLSCWTLLWVLFAGLYGATPFQGWDTSIVAASVVAQGLMTWKKAEHWLVWLIPVNVSAIGLYAATGAYAFSFLYILYLANAWWGWRQWTATIGATAAIATAPPAERVDMAVM